MAEKRCADVLLPPAVYLRYFLQTKAPVLRFKDKLVQINISWV
jgi:hypothetical protein